MVTAHSGAIAIHLAKSRTNRVYTERMLKLVGGAAGAEALPALVRSFDADASRCSPASQPARQHAEEQQAFEVRGTTTAGRRRRRRRRRRRGRRRF